MTRRRILFVCALWVVFYVPGLFAADTPPLGIVLSNTGVSEFRRAPASTWLPAQPGMVLSAGDRLRTTAGTIRFAFCPDRSVQTLAAGRELQLPAAKLAAAGDALVERAPIASCNLPPIPENEEVRSRSGSSGPDSSTDCAGAKPDLLETLAQGARATAAGDSGTALTAYRRISCYEGATWTRGVLANLDNRQTRDTALQAKGETYALLIGISGYPEETKLAPLRYAHADAEALARFLREGRGNPIPADHIKLLTNEKATRAGIEDAVATFVRAARKPENTLILLLAGHGDYVPTKIDPTTGKVLETTPMFLTYDSYGQDPNTTGLRMSRFRDIVAQEALSFRRVIAYVDVCHAGETQEARDRELPDAVRKVFTEGQGTLGLMMATNKALAYESPHFGGGHGAFTYAVLEGLNGKVAPNASQQITFDDLLGFVIGRVRFLTNNAQTPTQLEVRYNASVLDNANAGHSVDLGEATPLTSAETGRREFARGRAAPEAAPQESTFERLLREDPLEAATEVERLPQSERSDGAERLRISLEDHGQQILIRYLRGEQESMVKSDFSLCAQYFGAALQYVPFDSFVESRMLFCEGRAAIFDRTPQSYAAATNLLGRAILLDPERAYAYNALGIAYLEQARGDAANYDRAVSAFQDAIRFAPRWAYPLHNLALAYSERGNFLAASRSYQQAMDLAPNYSYLPYNLGLLYQNVNRLDEAANYYRQAIETAERARRLGNETPVSPWRERALIWNALATVEMARHRNKQAQADLEKAEADDPRLSTWKHNRAMLLSRNGPSAEAERLWHEVIASDPPGLASRIALAEYLLRNRRAEEARTEFQILVASLPGQPEPGLPELKSLRSLLPFDASLLELYGDAAAHLGKTADAISGYEASRSEYRSRRDRQRVQKKRSAL